jgi:hypothetical protein
MKLVNKILFFFLLAGCCFLLAASCRVYSFRDVSIPPEIKTIKINGFTNQARYVNPQLSTRLKEAFEQKVLRQTRLTRTNSEDAHYKISGYISQYDVTTSGISSQQAATNRLTVGVHITLQNTLDNKTVEYDVSRNFDFPASLTLTQAESQLQDDILRNMSDEIFNRIFSNW